MHAYLAARVCSSTNSQCVPRPSHALRLGLGMIASIFIAGLPGVVHGQTYPTRPVHVVVAFTAGGTTDIVARSISEQLTERLKQPFLIDNRPGAGGNIGTEIVVRSTPDGYTLIVDSVGPIAVNPTLYKGLSYNAVTDLMPIVHIADVPNVLVVHPSLGVRNFEELITYAKANPGKLNYASTGIGTSSHLSGYVFCQRAGIAATHIPYKGAEALNDLLAGRVQFMFATIPSVIQYIQAGKLMPIAVSSQKRSRSLPEVPTVSERGIANFDTGSWFGLFAPKGTPEAVMTRLNDTVNEILAMPSVERQMVREGADPAGGTTAAFRQFVQSEYEKWKLIVRESGATPE
jgi:tripartite-type tricarboxylate transporter receptor subunit TctC